MRITKQHIGAMLATLFIGGIAIDSLGTARAEAWGYNLADCPSIVKQAIDRVSTGCTKIGANQLCYGNGSVHAEFQPGAGNPTFQAPGDVVDVSQVKQLTLSGMDTAAGTYGVAEMKVLANPAYLNGAQNSTPEVVTILLFGNVQLTAAAADASMTATVETATVGAAWTGTAATLQTLSPPQQTQLAGYETKSAIGFAAATKTAVAQITRAVPTETKLAGMVATATAKASTPTATGTIAPAKASQAAATATRLEGLISTATAAPTLAPTFTPTATAGPLFTGWQAFSFQSSGTAPCDRAPYDGMLIQSPKGGPRVVLSINGAFITLGSTLYVTAQASKLMTINTLEGAAIVTTGQGSWSAQASQFVQLPLDSNLQAGLVIGALGAGTGNYTADAVRDVPTGPLPNPVPNPPVRPAPNFQGWQSWKISFGPWTASPKNDPTDCPGFQPPPFGGDQTVGMLIDSSGDVWIQGSGDLAGASFIYIISSTPLEPRPDGSYQSMVIGAENDFDLNLTFTDATHATGNITYVTSISSGQCEWTESVTLTKQ